MTLQRTLSAISVDFVTLMRVSAEGFPLRLVDVRDDAPPRLWSGGRRLYRDEHCILH